MIPRPFFISGAVSSIVVSSTKSRVAAVLNYRGVRFYRKVQSRPILDRSRYLLNMFSNSASCPERKLKIFSSSSMSWSVCGC